MKNKDRSCTCLLPVSSNRTRHMHKPKPPACSQQQVRTSNDIAKKSNPLTNQAAQYEHCFQQLESPVRAAMKMTFRYAYPFTNVAGDVTLFVQYAQPCTFLSRALTGKLMQDCHDLHTGHGLLHKLKYMFMHYDESFRLKFKKKCNRLPCSCSAALKGTAQC